MYFYYVFAALSHFSRRIFFRSLPIWAATILAFAFVPAVQEDPYGAVQFGNLRIEFLLGALIGAAIKQRRHVRAALPLAIGFIALAVTYGVDVRYGLPATEGSFRFACVGLPLAAIVYASLRLERRARIVFPKALQSIGDASYSIYLWHSVLYAALGRVLAIHHLGSKIPQLALLVLLPPIVIGAGIVLYRTVEVPLSARARDLFATLLPRTMSRPGFARHMTRPVLG